MLRMLKWLARAPFQFLLRPFRRKNKNPNIYPLF